MNWITTNIRLPEEVYIQLKMKAVRERKSVAAVIREKLTISSSPHANATELKSRMRRLAKKIAAENPNTNFTEALIKMRYEQ